MDTAAFTQSVEFFVTIFRDIDLITLIAQSVFTGTIVTAIWAAYNIFWLPPGGPYWLRSQSRQELARLDEIGAEAAIEDGIAEGLRRQLQLMISNGSIVMPGAEPVAPKPKIAAPSVKATPEQARKPDLPFDFKPPSTT